MKSWLRHASVLVTALLCTAACGQGGQAAASKGTAAGGVEAQVAARFAERAGGKPDQVFKGPAGLFEVL